MLEDWEEIWTLWQQNHDVYENSLKRLKSKLNISFDANYAPWYLAGDWEETAEKIFICGLNPATPGRKNKWHEWQRKETSFDCSDIPDRKKLSWDKHLQFSQRCLANAWQEKITIGHYTRLSLLVYAYYGNKDDNNYEKLIPQKSSDRYRSFRPNHLLTNLDICYK
ncbi:MAG: hypothetical protein ACFFC7_22565 [Candidatus Hermodarchaeota archaeon]